MTENEKKALYIIVAVIVAIILLLLFSNKNAVKTIFNRRSANLPNVNAIDIPEYETPSFPAINNPLDFDGCKMCLSGNYSIIMPAGDPKPIPASIPSGEMAKILANSKRGGISSNSVRVASSKPWWNYSIWGR